MGLMGKGELRQVEVDNTFAATGLTLTAEKVYVCLNNSQLQCGDRDLIYRDTLDRVFFYQNVRYDVLNSP